jgi:hypothetical protein
MKARTLWAFAVVTMLVAASCGSRTELYVDLADSGSDAGDDTTLIKDSSADIVSEDSAIGPTCRPRSCRAFGYNCGPNGDGCGGLIQCGGCTVPEFCGGGGFSRCGGGFGLGPDGAPLCTPKTCLDLDFNCGPAGDGCGGMLQCGFCQFPDVCGGGGKPGHCGNSLPCTNLCLQQQTCDSGTTSVTGTIVAGTTPQFGAPDPIYNALVYVPNGTVQPFQPGVQCSQCGADVSGEPLVATQTAPDGTFTLVNMPIGSNIPLVIQLGRWRRQITIPNVSACTNTALPTSLTRLPRNQSEGDIPLTAIATGSADQTECVLLKMGIDQAEFTMPAGTGRIQMYVANGSDLGPGTPTESQLTSNPAMLANYDIVVLPCEGSELQKPSPDQQNLIGYTGSGGRVFATHYSYTWLYNDAPFSTTAAWDINQNVPNQATGTIDTSFQKGQDFATWLQAVGALSGPNQIVIDNVREDLDSVTPPSQRFIYGPGPFQYAFYTPVGQPPAQQCGRVVFSDFHVTQSGLSQGTTFPSECQLADAGPMTSQEKALEFMLFDLASCIPRPPQQCTPLTCAQENITCGPAGDGCGGLLACGDCPTPQTCGGGGVYGQCGYPDAGHCTPLTCQALGYNCGMNGDGCGHLVNCGTCVAPQICGGGGKPSVCGP